MDNVTFREVELKQSEAEKITNIKQEVSPLPDKMSNTEKDSIISPLSVYIAIKGRPYTVDFLGIKNYWDLLESDEKVDRTLGAIKTKVGVVENWVKRQIDKGYMEDNIDSYKQIMKFTDKIISHSTIDDPLQKLNKIYSFIVSTNKSRAINNLRKALIIRNIDELVDTEKVKPSILGRFMPRKGI